MIVTKTPLRISFFGGGSDIPQFYHNHPGMVISTAIDKQIKIAVNRCKTDHCRVVYSELEVHQRASDVKHDRVRAALEHFRINSNIEICSFSDVPTRGTGLGSSSTFTVGLVHALYKLNVLPHNKRDLAELACQIEMEKCGDPIGKQDQYAAAYGGFNVIRFDGNDVEVTPINCPSEVLWALNKNLFCYATGIDRKASDVLSHQVKNLTKKSQTFAHTKKIVDIAEQALILLKRGALDDFGALLHETWMEKRLLSVEVTNQHIDTLYNSGIEAGALGGKLLGAGGGGYMLFYVPEDKHYHFTTKMREYRRFHFSFQDQGSEAFVI